MNSEKNTSLKWEKFVIRKSMILISSLPTYYVCISLRLADTMNVTPDHAFGVTVLADELCKLHTHP